MHFLDNEGVVTEFIPTKPEHRTSAVVLGIEPPDKFPLVYYRDNCADINLTIDDVLNAPITDCKVFQFAGTNLSKEPSRSATMFAAELARANGAKVILDVDFRPDQWHDVRAFGVQIRAVLALVDIVIGTEDEINAAMREMWVSILVWLLRWHTSPSVVGTRVSSGICMHRGGTVSSSTHRQKWLWSAGRKSGHASSKYSECVIAFSRTCI